MHIRKLAAASVLAAASFTVAGLSAPAYALCESYSGGCPNPPGQGGGVIGGNDQLPGNDRDDDGTGSTDGGTGRDDAPVQGNGSRAGAGPGTTTTESPATLPFTGGELVLLTAIGAGALAGGTALVLAGRRRSGTA